MWVMTAVGADTELDETTGKKKLTTANQRKVEQMIQRADNNGDGDVDFVEFCELMSQVSYPERWEDQRKKPDDKATSE